LGRIKNKLTTQLIEDYRIWASQETQPEPKTSAKLSPDLGF
jgi:hypothetical protein